MDIKTKSVNIRGASDAPAAIIMALCNFGTPDEPSEPTAAEKWDALRTVRDELLAADITPDAQSALAAIEQYRQTIPAGIQSAESKIAELWQRVNSLLKAARLERGWDENAADAVTLWAAIGELPAWRVARLQDIHNWSDASWMTYYQVKALIDAGQQYALPENFPPCPWHFYQLLAEAS